MGNDLLITNWCIIRGNRIITNDIIREIPENFVNFAAFAKSLYKEEGISYPKFYKMDNLSKLAFLAAETIFKNSDVLQNTEPEKIGVVVANSVSSLDTDLAHQDTIRDRGNYFPSPSIFVYTLPNILIGEICIRHRIKGENAFLVSERFEPDQMVKYVSGIIDEGNTDAVLCGWADMLEGKWDAAFFLAEKRKVNETVPEFTAENLTKLYQNN